MSMKHSALEYKKRYEHQEFSIYKHTAISQALIKVVNDCELDIRSASTNNTTSSTTTTANTSHITLSEVTPIIPSNEVHMIETTAHDPVATLFPPSPATTTTVYVLHV